ncbi:hypothetical protein KUTeg_009978 [Tegillarca granosa]|uniref:Uncharacterized protein n=1 Tax=Tegillarca granosa TaxID=220873 RepID=A0ABQ9F5G4_TEGGR|nr:hypothetical protein KUTeg_009978 [Tegillarca granosa]
MHRFLTDKQTECVKSMHWNKSEEEKETRHFHQHAARRPRGRPRKNSLIFSSNTTLIPSTNKQKGAKRGRPCLNRINRAVQKNRKLKSLTSQIITPSHERFSKLKLKYSHKKKEIKHTTKETNKNTSFDFGSCKIAFSKYLLLNVAMIDNKDLNTDRKLNKMFPNIFCKFPRIFLEKIDLKLKDEKGIIDHQTLNGCSDKTSEIEIPQETQKLDDGIQDENFVLKGNKSIDNTRLTTDRNFLTKLGTERTLENLPDFSHHSAIDTDHTRFSNAHFRTVHVDLTNLKMKLKSFDISKYKTRKSYEDKIVSSTSQNQLELHDKNSKEGQSDSDGSNTNVIDRKMFSSETDDKSNERSDEIETPFLTQDREIISSETEAKSNECLDETETPVLTQELREELEVNNESCTLLVPPVLERERAKECLFLDSVSATNDVKKDSLDTLQRTVETTNTELDSRMSACVLPIHSETETSYLKLHLSNSNKDKQEETSADNIVQNPEQDLNVLKAETIVETECGDLDSSNIVAELKYAQPSYINTRENNLVKGQKYHVTVPLNYCHRNHGTNEHLGTNETENILLADIENNAKNSNKPGKHNHLSKVDHVSKKTDSSSKHQNADESRERTKSRSRSQSCDKGYDSDATVIYDDDVGSNESLALDKSYIDPNSVLSMQEFSPEVNDYVLSYKPNIGEWSEVEAYQQKLHKTFMRHCDELRFREVYRNENFRSETEGVIPIPSTVSLIMQDQTSTIKPKLIDGRKRGFKNPSFRRHLFGLKKSKASRTTAILS